MKTPSHNILSVALVIGAFFLIGCEQSAKTSEEKGSDPKTAGVPANTQTVSLKVSGMT